MKKLLITLIIPGAVLACPEHTTVKTPDGRTTATVRDSNVYLPNGQRVARVDSSGNIYSTSGSTGTPAGQRIGQVSKR